MKHSFSVVFVLFILPILQSNIVSFFLILDNICFAVFIGFARCHTYAFMYTITNTH